MIYTTEGEQKNSINKFKNNNNYYYYHYYYYYYLPSVSKIHGILKKNNRKW